MIPVPESRSDRAKLPARSRTRDDAIQAIPTERAAEHDDGRPTQVPLALRLSALLITQDTGLRAGPAIVVAGDVEDLVTRACAQPLRVARREYGVVGDGHELGPRNVRERAQARERGITLDAETGAAAFEELEPR